MNVKMFQNKSKRNYSRPLVQSTVVLTFSYELTRMDKNNSKYRKRDSGNADHFLKSWNKKNYSHKRKCHGTKKRECDENIKTDLQLQNVIDKNNRPDTEGSTEIISSSTATASNSKTIDIECNCKCSSIFTNIDMSILGDVFMLLSC